MNQIFAPNYTQIPNVIFDYWMNKLTPAEFKVLLCICRKTFGFHKQTDAISLKQIMEMTGLSSRSSLIKTLTSLEEHGLINKIKSMTEEGDPAPNRYEINVLSEDGGSTLSAPGVVPSEHKGVVLTEHIQKKENTKENIQKKYAQTRKSSSSPPADFSFSSSDKKFIGITEADLNDWKEAYPYADIGQELKKAEQWLLSNPSRARKKNWRKFVTTWLSKASDQAENKAAYRGSKANSAKRQGKLVIEGDSKNDGWTRKKAVDVL